MSRKAYKVKYTKPQVNKKARQIVKKTQVAIISSQKEQALSKVARIPSQKEQALSKLEWLPVQNEEFTTPENLVEIEVPDEWTVEDRIQKEKVLVSADEEGLTVIVSDSNLKEVSCERIARKFAGLLYKEVTGEELLEDEIDISPFAILRHSICEFCGEQAKGNPFTCPVCGRCFCYEHRRPESHGCKRGEPVNEAVEFGPKATRSDAGEKRRPKVAIRKIFCG